MANSSHFSFGWRVAEGNILPPQILLSIIIHDVISVVNDSKRPSECDLGSLELTCWKLFVGAVRSSSVMKNISNPQWSLLGPRCWIVSNAHSKHRFLYNDMVNKVTNWCIYFLCRILYPDVFAYKFTKQVFFIKLYLMYKTVFNLL